MLSASRPFMPGFPTPPLVLHGSSGVKEDSIKEVIAYGISKVNVATWLNQGFVEAMRAAVAKMPDETDPRKLVGPGREEVKARVREKLRVFGCAGVIDSSGGFASGKKVVPQRPYRRHGRIIAHNKKGPGRSSCQVLFSFCGQIPNAFLTRLRRAAPVKMAS